MPGGVAYFNTEQTEFQVYKSGFTDISEGSGLHIY
jgi:hypothetical protein